MELTSQEGEEEEMAIPLNSAYVGGDGGGGGGGHVHMIHHDPAVAVNNHIIPCSASGAQIPSNGQQQSIEDHHHHHNNLHVPYKKMVRYRECLKNHAAAMGGNATDGCGEFMPSGEEGTLEALTCSACNCHRNFHRKEIEGETHPSSCDCFHSPHLSSSRVGGGRKFLMGHHHNHHNHHHHHKAILGPESLGGVYPGSGAIIPSRPLPIPIPPQPQPHPFIMSYNMGSLPSESDEQEEGGGGGGGIVTRAPPHQLIKKRFRTKFSQEQKDKMFQFAEKVGWKIQKQEEAVVQQFCQEVGVKRRVLKVWMHNNKHNLAKKNIINSNLQNQIQE